MDLSQGMRQTLEGETLDRKWERFKIRVSKIWRSWLKTELNGGNLSAPLGTQKSHKNYHELDTTIIEENSLLLTDDPDWSTYATHPSELIVWYSTAKESANSAP